MMVTSSKWNAEEFSQLIEDKKMVFDNPIQRNLVWEIERKSLFIKTAMQGIPTFPIGVHLHDSLYDVVDGKQRCTTLQAYINDGFALKDIGMTLLNDGKEYDFNENKFSELPLKVQNKIKNYTLDFWLLNDVTREEVVEIFERWNNGKSLTSIEIMRVKAKSLKEFQEIAKHPMMAMSVSEKGMNRYKHEMVAMQAWGILYLAKPDFSAKIFKPIIQEKVLTVEEIDMIMVCLEFVYGVYLSLDLSNAEHKRVAKRIKTHTHLISSVYLAKICLEKGMLQDDFNNLIINFFKTIETSSSRIYNNNSSAHTANSNVIAKRLEALNTLINTFPNK